ncbi:MULTISPECIES: DUF2294 domain-containing protein [Ureibacillus]|uniref:DUF2294 domain-containing protein n=1 Tax=Ureibacillus thermophilus TaxID=367743 RepID=A0A4P6UWC7_9BACL|nr:DUF2294 domain-containing protein [Ureibacillus thermophilus]QBK26875.1 DUF2294 domain-containing protein [Ureibacillus thermophilus]
MSKKIHEFNNIIRKLRKNLFGKGPDRIHTVFIDNIVVSLLYGNLTPTERFIATTPEGAKMVHTARTTMIKDLYAKSTPKEMEELMGSKLLHLFTDIKIEEDCAVSVFIFEDPISE